MKTIIIFNFHEAYYAACWDGKQSLLAANCANDSGGLPENFPFASFVPIRG